MMNIIARFAHHFDSRIIFGCALLNINGETVDCEVTRLPNGSYAFRTPAGKDLCGPLWEYYIEPVGDLVPADMFQLTMTMASESGGDATLLLPLLWKRETDDEDDC